MLRHRMVRAGHAFRLVDDTCLFSSTSSKKVGWQVTVKPKQWQCPMCLSMHKVSREQYMEVCCVKRREAKPALPIAGFIAQAIIAVIQAASPRPSRIAAGSISSNGGAEAALHHTKLICLLQTSANKHF